MQLVAPAATAPANMGAGINSIQPHEFAQWMAQFGPFESAPRIAVAVSGGRDSMALACLAAAWVRARGGGILAVTVDHGLRAESASEAARVGSWMAAHNITHEVLTWSAPQTERAVEQSARTARYRLLENYCRDHGVLHLLVGHHLTDQLETHTMRRARDSGPDGLAGMAGLRELAYTRLLRPLLGVPRVRLTATLEVLGQDWIEDASNHDLRFERARLRAGGQDFEDSGVVARYGRDRAIRDDQLAALAAVSVRVDPFGFATINCEALRDAAPELSRSLLGNIVTSISGGVYPPRGARLSRLLEHIRDGRSEGARTLGGCMVRPDGSDKLLVCREFSGISGALAVDGHQLLWEGRFRVRVGENLTPGLQIDALGRAGVNAPEGAGHGDFAGLDRNVRVALPALYCGAELVARPCFDPMRPPGRRLYVRFAPQRSVAGSAFGKV